MGKAPHCKTLSLKLFPDASFIRLFIILGTEASEGKESEPKFKARAVVQRSWSTDASGAQVFYADTSSAPTSMACIKSVVTFGQLTELAFHPLCGTGVFPALVCPRGK